MDKPRVSDNQMRTYVALANTKINMGEPPTTLDLFALDLLDARRHIAELEKDAERYRAIRDGRWEIVFSIHGLVIVRNHHTLHPLELSRTPYDLDSTVDKVIAAQRQKERE